MVIGLWIAVLLLLLFGWWSTYRPFGKRPSKDRSAHFERLPYYKDGRFFNEEDVPHKTSLAVQFSILKEFLKKDETRKPSEPLPMDLPDFSRLQDNGIKVIWFGHSAFYFEMAGKTFLVDPMFGRAPSPFQLFGGKRYSHTLPFQWRELPAVDVIILSHDHYDHLDYRSVQLLKEKTKHWLVPAGVGSHLERWGISSQIITERCWWEQLEWEGLTLICTPSRHFSGRNIHDRNKTLWCSWVVISEQQRFFYSGDGGYGAHFKQIGQRYGPFDIAMMECGQYDERWKTVHMLPEETVTACLDVKGARLIPVHWGAFTLSLHAWQDPIERVTKAAERHHVPLITPKIGEACVVGKHEPHEAWWQT
ncbi:outer membrane protein RomA [Fictibacillus macauensis ZFHKF-1]|uniref:Outer membrane protein RomA n=1 Tax=Fictibacillus macauensis ZFHKF-1 TaxID=1196324 RepID=I8J5Q5_9BACL|nr:MBL fold metallo-hydrolase [Fictibacillus macauensis]EIT87136.1 outer membrane protein RomA [Fictibacillus macauensis ZFHKF-1]